MSFLNVAPSISINVPVQTAVAISLGGQAGALNGILG